MPKHGKAHKSQKAHLLKHHSATCPELRKKDGYDMYDTHGRASSVSNPAAQHGVGTTVVTATRVSGNKGHHGRDSDVHIETYLAPLPTRPTYW